MRDLASGKRSVDRILQRATRTMSQRGAQPAEVSAAAGNRPSLVEPWLADPYAADLAAIDRLCGEVTSDERYALFRHLDDDVWAMLLTQDFALFPNIRAALPEVPATDLQELWNGRSGLHLAQQSSAFYAKLREAYRRHGAAPLSEARVLDFGCGWGRLTRYLSRDLAPGNLFGCDPLAGILDTCRQSRVPATLAVSEFLPTELPFDGTFDLIYAFSVFTHLSERAAERCLGALHRGLAPRGVLVLTVRPRAFTALSEPLRVAAEHSSPGGEALPGAQYVFAPHRTAGDASAMWGDSDPDYGDAIVTIEYVRERWSEHLELVEVGHLLSDPHQVVLTFTRR